MFGDVREIHSGEGGILKLGWVHWCGNETDPPSYPVIFFGSITYVLLLLLMVIIVGKLWLTAENAV